MECHEPGEIIVLPVEGGIRALDGILSEESLTVKYSIENVLEYYANDNNRKTNFNSFPSVLNVPEGKEHEYTDRLLKYNIVKSVSPNYLVRPSFAEIQLNNEYIEAKMIELGCYPNSEYCGKNVKIAIIDTGVNKGQLLYQKNLHPIQYQTDYPTKSNFALFDNYGHGTAVAYIINRIAPSSQLFSIKMMDNEGNIGGLLSALYLAEAYFKPHIYNLSLSFSCDATKCGICGNSSVVNVDQLQLFFSVLNRNIEKESPLIIAAAGNAPPELKMPANFSNILAVGSDNLEPPNTYNGIDPNFFILAPGGTRDSKNSIGNRLIYGNSDNMYGTSYSAAFVSGIAARYLCALESEFCLARHVANNDQQTYRDYILSCIKNNASQDVSNYDKNVHGLGVVRFR